MYIYNKLHVLHLKKLTQHSLFSDSFSRSIVRNLVWSMKRSLRILRTFLSLKAKYLHKLGRQIESKALECVINQDVLLCMVGYSHHQSRILIPYYKESVTDIYGIEGPGGFSRRAVDGRGPPGKLRLRNICWSSSDGALQQIGLISYLNLEI